MGVGCNRALHLATVVGGTLAQKRLALYWLTPLDLLLPFFRRFLLRSDLAMDIPVDLVSQIRASCTGAFKHKGVWADLVRAN